MQKNFVLETNFEDIASVILKNAHVALAPD